MNTSTFESQINKRDSIKQYTLSLKDFSARTGGPLKVKVADICVRERLVPEDPIVVRQLVASFERDRQIVPVLVRQNDGQVELLDGLNRLRAAQLLNWDELVAYVMHNVSDDEAKAFEAISNRHRRQKLSALDRAMSDVTILEHVTQKVTQVAAPPGGKQPKEQFIAKTARELGVSPDQIARSRKIATIDLFVREQVRRYKLENNQSILLEIAKSGKDVVAQNGTLARLLSARKNSESGGKPEDQHVEQAQSPITDGASRDESFIAGAEPQRDLQAPSSASSSDASTNVQSDVHKKSEADDEMTAITLSLPTSMNAKMTLAQPDSRVQFICVCRQQDNATCLTFVVEEVCHL